MSSSQLNKLVSEQIVNGKSYTYRLLKRREAADVFHTSVSVLLMTLAEASGSAVDSGAAFLASLGSIDFDVFWRVASAVLRGVVIREDPSRPNVFIAIEDIEETNYFDDNREELYAATFFGLKANYPNSFARLDRAIGGFVQQAVEVLGGQNVPSQTDGSKSSSSPAGTE